MNKKQKSSPLWRYFSVVDEKHRIAKCDLCAQKFSFKSTISNLKSHLTRRHPSVPVIYVKSSAGASVSQAIKIEELSGSHDDDDIQEIQESTSNERTTSPNTSAAFTSSTSATDTFSKQSSQKQSSCLKSARKMNAHQEKKLDRLLLDLFIKDFQPLQIVENAGFVNFVQELNPSYSLPSRKTISYSLIPACYQLCLDAVHQVLSTAKSVCLTTDSWTSKNAENYLAVTAHFLSQSFELQSILLGCSKMDVPHTSANIANKFKEIVSQFGLIEKVSVVVTDNEANIKVAIENHLGWKHFACYAHTINLIVQNALEEVKELSEKIKTVVRYFKRTAAAEDVLFSTQETFGVLEPKKLIQEVPTRWNSVYDMLNRMLELKDAVKTSIALINKDLPILSEEEWTTCDDLCKVLKPFKEVTTDISGDKYVTGSQVLIITKSLKGICNKVLEKEKLTTPAINVVKKLHQGLAERFQNIEHNECVALCSLLDPRFKLIPFTDPQAIETVKNCATDMMESFEVTGKAKCEPQPEDSEMSDAFQSYSVWEEFDRHVKSKVSIGATSTAMIELNQYLESKLLRRSEDPLVWWKQNSHLFPSLSRVAQLNLNMVASSVPGERIFSKAGLLLNEKRTRLSSKHLQRLLFLNSNSYVLK